MSNRDTLREDVAYVRDSMNRASTTIPRSIFCGQQLDCAASHWSISLKTPAGSGFSGCWQVPVVGSSPCGSAFARSVKSDKPIGVAVFGSVCTGSGLSWPVCWVWR